MGRRLSVVGIVTRPRAGQSGVRIVSVARVVIFSESSEHLWGGGGGTQLSVQWVSGNSCPGGQVAWG